MEPAGIMEKGMEVSWLTPGQYRLWNDFTTHSPQGCIFGNTDYLEACQADFGILVCRRGDEIVGGIALPKSKWGRHTNPQLCKYLGIFMHPFEGGAYTAQTNSRKVQELLIEAIARKRRFDFMFHPEYTDWLPFYWSGYKQTTRYTYRIPLENAGDVAGQYHSRLRGKINKADRERGFERIVVDDRDVVLDLMSKTFAHQGIKSPFKTAWLYRYLEMTMARRSMIITGIKNIESGAITGILGILRDNRAHYLILNGIDHQNIGIGQNEWLIHDAIMNAQAEGMKYFDFEGSMLKNVESFYRQFGGILTPYFHIRRP